MHWLFPLSATLLVLANNAGAMVPSQVIIRNTLHATNCSGVVVSPNLILTSGQCAFTTFPAQLKVYTKSAERNPFNVTRVLVHNQYTAANLTNDVALLQLNGTTVASPVSIDYHQAQSQHCEANFVHGSPSLHSTHAALEFCKPLYNVNVTSCANYTITPFGKCDATFLAAERGTPIVCNGYLTGVVSAIVFKNPTVCRDASAHVTRMTPSVASWISQTIQANRPIHQIRHDHSSHVNNWSGTGTFAKPTWNGTPKDADVHHHAGHAGHAGRNGSAQWLASVLMVIVSALLAIGV